MTSVCDECVQVRSDELNNFAIEAPRDQHQQLVARPLGNSVTRAKRPLRRRRLSSICGMSVSGASLRRSDVHE